MDVNSTVMHAPVRPEFATSASFASPELQNGVERFLYFEAYLLDERRFNEWVDLFTEDATYSISVREAVQQREEGRTPLNRAEPSLVDEGRTFLATRVKRLETHLAHAEQPPSLTRHLITNVLVHSSSNEEKNVSSNFQLYQARSDVSEHVFYGARNDVLRSVDGEWRIARRQVVLDTSLLPRTITVFF